MKNILLLKKKHLHLGKSLDEGVALAKHVQSIANSENAALYLLCFENLFIFLQMLIYIIVSKC